MALKTFHPLLGPDVLYVLAAMGHGDEIGVVDRNFPTVSMSRRVSPLLGADHSDSYPLFGALGHLCPPHLVYRPASPSWQ